MVAICTKVTEWRDLGWWRSSTESGASGESHTKYKVGVALQGKWDDCAPPWKDVYKAMELTPFDQVRVVILGQDPYPTPGHANGMAFSVPREAKRWPQTLVNIFDELYADVGIKAQSGDLTPWAKQGVLLLNTILTCAVRAPLSHQGLGWEGFTTTILQALVMHRKKVVFVLWGRKAFEALQDAAMLNGMWKEFEHAGHKLVTMAHPSPRSAARGFFGTKPFSKINAVIDGPPIDWNVP